MTPDLYAAWLTAGDRLQPVGAWLAGGGAWAPILTVAAVLVWRIRRAARKVDRILGEPAKRETKPGRDSDLLLDCIAIYGDSDDLDRLRDAINQHRKENPL